MNDIHDPHRSLRLGVAGPVGTGKSSLIATVCRNLADDLRIGVITDEDARFLRSAGVLPAERIRAVETGACPHTAIRDDITMNLIAVEDLERDFAPLDLVFVESGGDNLTATFSRDSSTRRSSSSTSPVVATWRAKVGRGSPVRIC